MLRIFFDTLINVGWDNSSTMIQNDTLIQKLKRIFLNFVSSRLVRKCFGERPEDNAKTLGTR